MDPDFDLICALQQGQQSAMAEIMGRHKQSIFHFVLRFTGNQADAAELTEETFVKVYFNAARFKPQAKVKTWIFTIAHNLCRDHARKNKRHRLESLDANHSFGDNQTSLLDHLPDESPSAGDETETRELEDFLQEQIHSLPDKLKIPFIHCILDGMSQDECAQILSTSTKTVETRIYRARKRLKEQMDRRFP